jgi:hypothetical protein
MLLVRKDEANEFGKGIAIHFLHDLGTMRLERFDADLQVGDHRLVGFPATTSSRILRPARVGFLHLLTVL